MIRTTVAVSSPVTAYAVRSMIFFRSSALTILICDVCPSVCPVLVCVEAIVYMYRQTIYTQMQLQNVKFPKVTPVTGALNAGI